MSHYKKSKSDVPKFFKNGMYIVNKNFMISCQGRKIRFKKGDTFYIEKSVNDAYHQQYYAIALRSKSIKIYHNFLVGNYMKKNFTRKKGDA